MINPLVSVIMPAYNAQQYIAASITSVLKQSYNKWELIVVDDGSTDKTASVVKNLQATDPRIKYYYQPNSKQGKARNTGINHSLGSYLAFLDADDLWISDKLQVQIETMAQFPDYSLFFTPGYFLSSNCITKPYEVKIKNWTWAINRDELIDCNQIPILSVLVKKEAVVKSGFFSEETGVQNAEDYHLWIKILSKGYQFKSIDKPSFYYRVHNSQNTYQEKVIQEAIIACYADLVDSGVLDPNNIALRNRVRWMFFHNIEPGKFVKQLKSIFPKSKLLLPSIILFKKLFPQNKLVNGIAFRLL